MPNWCSNKLVVTGEPKQLALFAKSLGENNAFSLTQLVPIPEILRSITFGSCVIDGETHRTWFDTPDGPKAITQEEKDKIIEEHGCSDWYSWATENWGTKWDVNETLTVEDEEVYGWFDTAWSPPSAWAANVSAQFPELTITLYYAEGGSGFYGKSTYVNGEQEDCCDSEDFWVDEDEWNDDYEEYADNCTEECREFLQRHGLHTGG